MSHVRVPPSWSACLIGCVDRTRRSLVWTLMEIRRGDLFPILDLKKDIIGLVCPILWAWIREKTGRVLNLGRGRVMNIACHCLLQDGKQTLHHLSIFIDFFTTIATHMSIFTCMIGVSPPPRLPTHLLLTQVGIPSIHGWGAIKHLLFHLFHLSSAPYTVLCQLGVDIMSTHG